MRSSRAQLNADRDRFISADDRSAQQKKQRRLPECLNPMSRCSSGCIARNHPPAAHLDCSATHHQPHHRRRAGPPIMEPSIPPISPKRQRSMRFCIPVLIAIENFIASVGREGHLLPCCHGRVIRFQASLHGLWASRPWLGAGKTPPCWERHRMSPWRNSRRLMPDQRPQTVIRQIGPAANCRTAQMEVIRFTNGEPQVRPPRRSPAAFPHKAEP